MGQFALPLAIISTAFDVMGAVQDASAAKKTAKANAQISANNAIVAEANAKYEDNRAADARRRGQADANILRRRLAQVEGKQRSGYAGGGVMVDTGSPLDILVDTNTLAGYDIFTTIDNAEREAYGNEQSAYNFRAEGTNYTNQSSLYRSQAAGISPLMRGISAGISGASGVSSKWSTLSGPWQSSSNLPWQSPGNVNPQGGYY
jgi:hypothetical protein